jgi:hypothetical protein
MAICIVTVLFLALFHWWYEAFLAPTLRMLLRFKAFSLRDRLRRLHIEKSTPADPFLILHRYVNFYIQHQSRLDAGLLLEVARHEYNDKLSKVIAKKQALLDAVDNAEFQKVNRELSRLTMLSFCVNSGAWYIYLIPLLLTVSCAKFIANLAKTVMVYPEHEISRMLPACPTFA